MVVKITFLTELKIKIDRLIFEHGSQTPRKAQDKLSKSDGQTDHKNAGCLKWTYLYSMTIIEMVDL